MLSPPMIILKLIHNKTVCQNIKRIEIQSTLTNWYKVVEIWSGLICVQTSRTAQQLSRSYLNHLVHESYHGMCVPILILYHRSNTWSIFILHKSTE
jgi:hypothetical protein